MLQFFLIQFEFKSQDTSEGRKELYLFLDMKMSNKNNQSLKQETKASQQKLAVHFFTTQIGFFSILIRQTARHQSKKVSALPPISKQKKSLPPPPYEILQKVTLIPLPHFLSQRNSLPTYSRGTSLPISKKYNPPNFF